jgi:hypothetical protein
MYLYDLDRKKSYWKDDIMNQNLPSEPSKSSEGEVRVGYSVRLSSLFSLSYLKRFFDMIQASGSKMYNLNTDAFTRTNDLELLTCSTEPSEGI